MIDESKSTNYNLQTWPVETTFYCLYCFLRGPLRWLTEAKNINVGVIFDLRSHVIAKHSNVGEETASRWQHTACDKPMCLLRVERSDSKTLSCDEFCFLGNICHQYNLNFCSSGNSLFSYELLIGSNKLFRNVLLFSWYQIVQPCLSDPSYSSCTLSTSITL